MEYLLDLDNDHEVQRILDMVLAIRREQVRLETTWCHCQYDHRKMSLSVSHMCWW